MRLINNVSIHAPTRGATKRTSQFGFLCIVSIHAPTRGATCRHYLLRERNWVSIHAPTRGATIVTYLSGKTYDSFNPRTHEGCDIDYECKCTLFRLFQSTHPRGVRHATIDNINMIIEVSIHAPTRGATLAFRSQSKQSEFQSTHPRGVRHNDRHSDCSGLRFQSTHPRGVRHGRAANAVLIIKFQSTHPRGVRPA